MAKPDGVPRWDWYLHEAWWRLTRWPESERRHARSAITNYYVNRHLRQAVQAAGIHEDRQPQAWQHLVRCLDQSLGGPGAARCCTTHSSEADTPAPTPYGPPQRRR